VSGRRPKNVRMARVGNFRFLPGPIGTTTRGNKQPVQPVNRTCPGDQSGQLRVKSRLDHKRKGGPSARGDRRRKGGAKKKWIAVHVSSHSREGLLQHKFLKPSSPETGKFKKLKNENREYSTGQQGVKRSDFARQDIINGLLGRSSPENPKETPAGEHKRGDEMRKAR